MKYLSNRYAEQGFTLMETVIVIGLMVLIGGAITNAIIYFYRNNTYVLEEGTAVQSARNGTTVAVQNFREASYGDDGSYPIASAGTSTVTFYANVNGSTSVQKIRYFLQGQTLYRGVTTASGIPPSYAGQPEVITTVATYIQNTSALPIYTYYDNTGAQLSLPITLSSIATITTTLKIDVNPNRSPVPYTLIESATLRNL
jgi:type II secretory pathway pseudopilin PulG